MSASRLKLLIQESQVLEEIGSKIQHNQEVGLGNEEIEQFVQDYRSWYAQCLATLPEDLKERFRTAYEKKWKGLPLSGIKIFLENSTKTSMWYSKTSEGKEVGAYWQHPFGTSFRAPLRDQRQILLEAAARIESAIVSSGPIEIIEHVTRRFGLFCRQLQHRYNKRPTISVSDEYDVQNLIHALLKLFFDDVRAEETTPSYAGGRARIDFLLKSEKTVIETKKTRSNLRDKEVGEEIIIDIARYSSHQDCNTLIAFIYDPDHFIRNPRGLENDLSKYHEDLLVKVIVSQ